MPSRRAAGGRRSLNELESVYVGMRVAPTGVAGHPFKPERIVAAIVDGGIIVGLKGGGIKTESGIIVGAPKVKK